MKNRKKVSLFLLGLVFLFSSGLIYGNTSKDLDKMAKYYERKKVAIINKGFGEMFKFKLQANNGVPNFELPRQYLIDKHNQETIETDRLFLKNTSEEIVRVMFEAAPFESIFLNSDLIERESLSLAQIAEKYDVEGVIIISLDYYYATELNFLQKINPLETVSLFKQLITAERKKNRVGIVTLIEEYRVKKDKTYSYGWDLSIKGKKFLVPGYRFHLYPKIEERIKAIAQYTTKVATHIYGPPKKDER